MTKIKVVLTAEQACEIVLGLFDGVMRDGKPERFVIQSRPLLAGCSPLRQATNGQLPSFVTGNEWVKPIIWTVEKISTIR